MVKMLLCIRVESVHACRLVVFTSAEVIATVYSISRVGLLSNHPIFVMLNSLLLMMSAHC